MKRARLIIILLAVAVLGFLVFAFFRDREPVYQGRTLSDWIAESRNVEGDVRFLETNSAWQGVSRNLKQMAPEAIPWLLKWVQAKDSVPKQKVAYWVNAHRYLHLHIKTAWDFNRDAMEGFELLGDKGKPAWPALIQFTHSSDPNCRVYSLMCLFDSKADKEVLLPAFLRLIHDPDKGVQMHAANMFNSRFPQEAEAAGAYKIFPGFKSKPTEQSFTNQPPAIE